MTQKIQSHPIAGIVLAGGQSSRMGHDKASLIWKQASLLDHARHVLKQTGCQKIWVSGKPDEPDGLKDSQPNAGPGRALIDALTIANDHQLQGILAIPVDMPKLTPDILLPLIKPPLSLSRSWQHHPLPVFLPVSLIQTDLSAVRSIRDLLQSGPNERPVLDDNLLPGMDNINTPEDFSTLK